MKKYGLLISLTAVILSLLLFVFSASAAVLGDVDLDGTLSIIDATEIQKHLASLKTLTEEQQKAGMVADGEYLSILDATYIQKKLASLIDRFPVEDPVPPTAAPTESVTEKEKVTKVNEKVDIYFSNNEKWSVVNAYLYNSSTGIPMTQWPGSAMKLYTTNSYGEQVYKLNVDTSKYDRIIFNNGFDQTTDTPVTKASSGYFIMGKIGKKYVTGVYPYSQNGEGKITTVSLEYSKGYNKKVYIWTPEGYNPSDKSKKYSVLYMCDGQNLFGQTDTLSGYEWECDETVLSLMQNGGDGVIVVGIDNSNNKRDSELTPNIGEVSAIGKSYGSFENGSGKEYCDFVVEKVVPYVEQNYNTNSIRGIAGSSSGGIEAFYIGLEHQEMFSYIGALSPAFVLYDEAVWKNYLKSKTFNDNSPMVYIYNGKGDTLEKELYKNAYAMPSWMKSCGYSEDKILWAEDTDATHNEIFWAVYFPECISFGLEV